MINYWHVNYLKSIYWTWNNNRSENSFTKIRNFIRHHHAILVYPKVNIRNKGGQLVINDILLLGSVWELSSYKQSDLRLFHDSVFEVDNFKFYTGFNISVNPGARLSIGSGYANYNLRIDCFKEIQIGQNVAIAHNVIIRDGDNHRISGQSDNPAAIIIGNHVWIGMNSIILKGVSVGDGSVIAAGSVVTHNVPCRTLVGGVPARIIRQDIEWQ